MDGNLTGVRATSAGFQAFCSSNGEEMHLGFFDEPGLASQIADLGTINAALEAGLPLQLKSSTRLMMALIIRHLYPGLARSKAICLFVPLQAEQGD